MTEERGREDRQVTEVAQRRRRDDSTIDSGASLKMAIPQEIAEKLKAEGRTPRWINDVGSRVHDLTIRDDWDRVEGVEPRSVKIDKEGEMTKAILVSKRNDFIEDDRRKKDAVRLATEEAMLTGKQPGTDKSALAPEQYADPANKIVRDNRILE